MNFLAHIYLSGDDPDILLGNFMADQVKGRDLSRFEETVRNGIVLHRMIDHFTDTNAVSGKARTILRGSMGKYAGVVLDVFYDHFLATKWKDHHHTELSEYIGHVYHLLSGRTEEMPEHTQILFNYMKKNDWLGGYANIEGIERTLVGLSSRVKQGGQMAHSKVELVNNYDELSDNFDEFFPLLKEECRDFLKVP